MSLFSNAALPTLRDAVAAIPLTDWDLSLGQAAQIQQFELRSGVLWVELKWSIPKPGDTASTERLVQAALQAAGFAGQIKLTQSVEIRARAVQKPLKPLPGVGNIVAVASGKGGVGKSTVAVNLALAWSAMGARVGILDADIYGPSLPLLLGIAGQRPTSVDGKKIEPVLAHGLKVMSIGLLIDADQPAVWRGPMVTQALTQLLQETIWGDLDYLVIDMPPGTGDLQLTLAQRVPVAGAVIVTTPQTLAVADARKGLKMFEKVDVAVLGVVENMATHVCSACGHADAVFAHGGGELLAAEAGLPLLGRLPLHAAIATAADEGRPSVLTQAATPHGQAYFAMARRTAGALARRPRDRASPFGAIVVEEKS